MTDTKDVAAVYLWQNGNVMVFDWNGQQIGELQGRHSEELEEKIRARSNERTEWYGFGGVRCTWTGPV
jgi:hypothetical protein